MSAAVLALVLVLILALAAFLSWLFCGLMVRAGPRDAPDGVRKLQTRAVPTAGGAALLAGAGLATLAAFLLTHRWPDAAAFRTLASTGALAHVVLLVGCLMIGLADDVKTIPTRFKLLALAALCLFAVTMGFRAEAIYLPGFGVIGLGPLTAIIGSAAWLIVMINAVNFMDGADGLAAGSLLAPFTAILIWLAMAFHDGALGPEPPVRLAAAALAIIGGIAGFLVWNLRGKLYAGDTGALTLGAIFASASLFTVQSQLFSGLIWFPATLALPFLVDVLMTLIWRARAGRNWLQPHRDHAYQLLVRSGWTGRAAGFLWWGFSWLCAGCALAAQFWPLSPDGAPHALPGFVVFAVLLVGGVAVWTRQRVTLGRRLAQAET
jgi:UDP-GlcNAc:undecaprenyl-phosphate/decaprenyl-phosphate GlcNAc-1-phosphate transferase